jgi:alkanesulfonate monooxygenase SsuD/methylene tetrahydromethanopterin reductase-like flavin-dependent oxidoreductase (luciferase family)
VEVDLVIITQGGVTWSEWCAVADACERFGITTLFGGDHYLSDVDELADVAHDIWTVIAGLSARSSTLRLGTLVTPITFRPPSVLANVVATADHISGGRIELGLGLGWMEREHVAFGLPFPRPRVRQQMLAEQLEIVHRLWTEARVTFQGSHYTLDNAPGLPKPVQSPLPIIVGGSGTPGTAVPAARFADEYNVAWKERPSEFAAIRQRVIETCREVGRDPATMRFSVPLYCSLGRTRAEAMERARWAYEVRPRDKSFDDWLSGTLDSRLFGAVEEVAAQLRPYVDAGAARVMIIHGNHRDLDSIQLIGEELAAMLDR